MSVQKSFLYAQTPEDESGSSSVKRKQPTARSFTVDLSKREKSKIDKMMGKFMFSGNIPFRIANNHYFKEFVRLLNPAYRVPSRLTLGNEILESVYNEVHSKMKNELKGRKGCLLQDGWSTSQNEPVISHCIHIDDTVHFLTAEKTTNNPKTAEYCFQLLEQAIEKSEKNLNAKLSEL